MSLVRVSEVDLYDYHISIKPFFREALHRSPQVAELFQTSDPRQRVVILSIADGIAGEESTGSDALHRPIPACCLRAPTWQVSMPWLAD